MEIKTMNIIKLEERNQSWPQTLIHPALYFDCEHRFASVGVIVRGAYHLITNGPGGPKNYPEKDITNLLESPPHRYGPLSGRWLERDMQDFLRKPDSPTFAEVFDQLAGLIGTHMEMVQQEYLTVIACWIIG
jgi:hypothetical protein